MFSKQIKLVARRIRIDVRQDAQWRDLYRALAQAERSGNWDRVEACLAAIREAREQFVANALQRKRRQS